MQKIRKKLEVRRILHLVSGTRSQSEDGFVFLSTLLLLTLLIPLSLTAFARLQTDLQISRNLLSSLQAFWIARAGAAVGRDWLARNLGQLPLPFTLDPRGFASGTYAVTIDRLENGNYVVTSTGDGPHGSRHVVEETIHVPAFVPVGAVTSDGDGLHPDFDDDSGGTGHRIPDFSIDGRNHTPAGVVSSACPAVSPFAATQRGALSDLISRLNRLKREIVQRANSFCQASGANAGGRCTPGLFWIRGTDVLPRFTSGTCTAADPRCFINLDLSAATLRASANPPELHTPAAPDNRGPFGPGIVPFVRMMSPGERTRLQDALLDMIRRSNVLPTDKVAYVRSDIRGGSHTYGTLDEPKVTFVEEDRNALDIDGRAVVRGAGVLIISRVVRLQRATLDWQGIVFIVDNGDLQVADADACGQINGAVVIRDNAAPDRKFDLDVTRPNGSCAPFAVNYSCEAVNRALSLLMRTEALIEKLGA